MIKITTKILLLTVCLSALFIISLVDAAIPSNVECKCENGGVRDTTVNYCLCTGCTSPYVLPFCSFQASTDVEFGITYNWTLDKDLFPYDRAESNIKNHFGIVEANFNFIRRIPNFEVGSKEVVAGFLMKGSDVIQLYNDVFASEKKSYLQDPQALNIWQLGTVVSAPGIFSRHFGSGNNLATVAISDGELRINDRQLEFFIAAIVIVIFLPIIEAVITAIFKPSAEQLDQEEMKYGTGAGAGDDKNTWEMSDRNNNNNKNTNSVGGGGAHDGDAFHQNQSPQPQDYNNTNNNNNSDYPIAYSTGNPLSVDGNNTNYAGVAGDVDDTYNNNDNNNDDTNQQQDYSYSSPPPPVPNHQSEYNNDNDTNHNDAYPSVTEEQHQQQEEQQQQEEPQQEQQQQEEPHQEEHEQNNHDNNDSHHLSTSSLPRSNRGSTLAPRPEYSPENLGPLKGEADLAPVPPPPSSFRG